MKISRRAALIARRRRCGRRRAQAWPVTKLRPTRSPSRRRRRRPTSKAISSGATGPAFVIPIPPSGSRLAAEEELANILKTSPAPIRAVGAGHSFMPLVPTTARSLSLDQMAGLVTVDGDEVTVRPARGWAIWDRRLRATAAPWRICRTSTSNRWAARSRPHARHGQASSRHPRHGDGAQARHAARPRHRLRCDEEQGSVRCARAYRSARSGSSRRRGSRPCPTGTSIAASGSNFRGHVWRRPKSRWNTHRNYRILRRAVHRPCRQHHA